MLLRIDSNLAATGPPLLVQSKAPSEDFSLSPNSQLGWQTPDPSRVDSADDVRLRASSTHRQRRPFFLTIHRSLVSRGTSPVLMGNSIGQDKRCRSPTGGGPDSDGLILHDGVRDFFRTLVKQGHEDLECSARFRSGSASGPYRLDRH